ncbi:ABC transporter permease [Streptomyces paludis]|uniref:ABC transporter permease n=1 Tax=Streptomyces paludis TaxID=2282738 RepID=A0A345HNG5_9ACTN|nr:ABC transporter permease [Streptomyces paludis]AXG78239.1 ABC transporter permease [Streptomyces paludis]
MTHSQLTPSPSPPSSPSSPPPWLRPVRLSPSDLLRLGLVGIRTRRMRAALSALGISIGIATMILVTGIPTSSQRALEAELTALGTDRLQAVADSKLARPGERAAFPAEAAAMVARIGPVKAVAETANVHRSVRRSDRVDAGLTAGLTVQAARPNLIEVINTEVRSGSYLTDVTEKFPSAVLGAKAAATLGFTRITPGAEPPQILIGKSWFSVVGILRTTPLTPAIDGSVLIGWDAARDHLAFDGRPTQLFIQAEESAIEDVYSVLPTTIAPQNPGLAKISRPTDALAAKRSTQSAFSGLFIGLAGVALLVGGIGVANTMVISVLERRKEIGLRRALGASRGQIRAQFLTESIALSSLGGVAGVVLGATATMAYAAYRAWPMAIPLPAAGGSLAGAVLVGVLAGVYPAVRAARLPPTEALSAT